MLATNSTKSVLRADLRAFLSYEAPWLLAPVRRLPDTASPEELETALLKAIVESIPDSTFRGRRDLPRGHPRWRRPGRARRAARDGARLLRAPAHQVDDHRARTPRDAPRDAPHPRDRRSLEARLRQEGAGLGRLPVAAEGLPLHRPGGDRRRGAAAAPPAAVRARTRLSGGRRQSADPRSRPGADVPRRPAPPDAGAGRPLRHADERARPARRKPRLRRPPAGGPADHRHADAGRHHLRRSSCAARTASDFAASATAARASASGTNRSTSPRHSASAVVFVVQNNRWALGTHVSEQTAARRFSLRGPGYGMPGITVFGNDPDEVAAACTWAAERARNGLGPTLVELLTYRRSGHAHHDDDRFQGNPKAGIAGYRLDDEARAWEALDPIVLSEARLLESGIATADDLAAPSRRGRRSGARRGRRSRGGAVAGAGRIPLASRAALVALPCRRRCPPTRRASAWRPTRRCGRRSSRRWKATPRCSSSAKTSAAATAAPSASPAVSPSSSARERCVNAPIAEWRDRRLRGGRGDQRLPAGGRDAVRRLPRFGLQRPGQQRRQAPLALGPLGADGGAPALRRRHRHDEPTARRRAVPQPVPGDVVRAHARLEDRGAVDAERRRRACSTPRCATTTR